MQLLVLGPGCTKCRKLAEAAEQAARELGLQYQLSKVTDLHQILALRVMMTPALVVETEISTSSTTIWNISGRIRAGFTGSGVA